MIGAILTVILREHDQSVVGEWAVRDRLYQQAHGQIVVRLLRLGRVDTRERRVERAHVIVAEAHERERGQLAVRDVLVELALPLLVAPA